MLSILHVKKLYLGAQGENNAQTITIDVKPWLAGHPAANITIYHKRDGDEVPYPTGAVLDREEGVIRWTPTSTDTYVQGDGEAEIRMYENGAIKKSRIIETRVDKSVTAGGLPAGSGWQDYINRMEGFAETAEDAKGTAVEAAGDAQEAQEAAEAARDAAQAAAGEFQGMTAEVEGLDADDDPTIEVEHEEGGLYNFKFGAVPGTTFTPAVSEQGVLSWSNDGGKTNPESVNIKGPQGDPAPAAAVKEAVDDWLDENVAQETGYVLDRSLQESNAAAPADLVGDLKNDLEDTANIVDEISFSYSIGKETLVGTVNPNFTIGSSGSIRENSTTSTELIIYPVIKDTVYYLTSDGFSTASSTPGVIFTLSDEFYDRMTPTDIVYVGNASNIPVNEQYTPASDGYLVVLHYTSGARGSLTISKDIIKTTAVDENARAFNEFVKENDYSLNLFDKSSPNVYVGYPSSSENKYTYASTARTIWIECMPNTEYIISKLKGTRFTVAYGSEEPKNNAVVESIITDNTAEFIVFKTSATAKYIGAFIWASNADTVTFEEMVASVKVFMIRDAVIAALNNREILGTEMISDFSAMTPIGGATYSDGTWSLPENGGISKTIEVIAGTTYFINPTVDTTSVTISDQSTNFKVNPLLITLGDDSISIFANEDANWKVCLTPTTSGSVTFSIQCQQKLSLDITALSIMPVVAYHDISFNINGLSGFAYRQNFAFGNGQRKIINGNGAQANVAVGFESQRDVNTGYANTAVGFYTQRFLTNGRANSAFGNGAQQRITTGMYNNAFGTVCQGYITSGCWNNAIGNEAQRDLTSGNNNTAIGRRAQSYITTGNMNTAIGSMAGFARINDHGTQGDYATKTASFQTLIGGESVQGATTPQDYATALGYRTKSNKKSVALGANAEALGEESVVIGFGVTTSTDHEIVIGNTDSIITIAGKRITFNQDGSVTWESMT